MQEINSATDFESAKGVGINRKWLQNIGMLEIMIVDFIRIGLENLSDAFERVI